MESQELTTTMGFNEFMAFIAEGESPIPKGQVLVPLMSSSHPFYTAWMFRKSLVDRMVKGAE
jgi:hypothetical protein